MKALKENMNGIILCIFEILVGILLLINPVGFTAGIIAACGVVLMAVGLAGVIRYFRTDAQAAAAGGLLTRGLLALLIGGFCAFRSQWFVATFPVLTIIYGVIMLVAGLGKVQITVDMLRLKRSKWFVAAISALLSIVCALIILSRPFASTAVLWNFTGATLIIEAVVDAVSMILNRSK